MKLLWVLLAVSVSCDKNYRREARDEPSQLGSPEGLEIEDTIITTLASESLIKENDDVDTMNMKADDSGAAIGPSPNLPTDNIATIKEQAPPFSRAVWDTNYKICLLGEFQADFGVTYPAVGGDQTVIVHLPEEAKTKGRCAYQHQDPVLELTWTGFRFTLTFSKLPEPKSDTWVVTSMELMYNTDASMFTGVTNGGIETARSAENVTLFATPESKSFFCPVPQVIDMYNTKREKVVSATLQNVRLQPFGIKRGKFSPVNRCSSVRIGSQMTDAFEQDETVPIAVGSTLAVAAILVVVGYAFYKSFILKRVDYNTME